MALIPFFSTQRTPSKLAIAVHLLLCGVPLFTHSTATAAETTTAAATKTYSISAGPLNQQLNQFAAQSGVYLVGNAQLTTGKTGPSLQGNYSVDGGFSALLAGSGLQVIAQPNGVWRLQKIPQGDEMLVVAGINRNGVTEGTQSYTTRSMNTATQLNLSPRETPQSVSVVTRQRMDDQN
ncbi:TonB-dependent siderophore receptor, partial [Pantoea agglomerans]|uniref:STN domain-containing protein n=2 Tax=Enterobacterales TaxID=91347 RepID=UPI00202D5BB0|nr:TonB-dependent siderophore receptor [Pantoea agglomerans]